MQIILRLSAKLMHRRFRRRSMAKGWMDFFLQDGIDYDIWNPETDGKIDTNYSIKDVHKGKAANKRALQEALGLTVDENKMLIGLISRLTDQKGLDLIAEVMEQIVDDNTQFVVIGTGDERYENMFRHYAWKYPNKVSANIYYADEMSHKLYLNHVD